MSRSVAIKQAHHHLRQMVGNGYDENLLYESLRRGIYESTYPGGARLAHAIASRTDEYTYEDGRRELLDPLKADFIRQGKDVSFRQQHPAIFRFDHVVKMRREALLADKSSDNASHLRPEIAPEDLPVISAEIFSFFIQTMTTEEGLISELIRSRVEYFDDLDARAQLLSAYLSRKFLGRYHAGTFVQAASDLAKHPTEDAAEVLELAFRNVEQGLLEVLKGPYRQNPSSTWRTGGVLTAESMLVSAAGALWTVDTRRGDKAIRALISHACNDEYNVDPRMHIINELKRVLKAEHVDAMQPLLNHDDPHVAIEALRTVGSLAEYRLYARNRLKDFMRSPSLVRAHAAEALVRMSGLEPETLQFFTAAAARHDTVSSHPRPEVVILGSTYDTPKDFLEQSAIYFACDRIRSLGISRYVFLPLLYRNNPEELHSRVKIRVIVLMNTIRTMDEHMEARIEAIEELGFIGRCDEIGRDEIKRFLEDIVDASLELPRKEVTGDDQHVSALPTPFQFHPAWADMGTAAYMGYTPLSGCAHTPLMQTVLQRV